MKSAAAEAAAAGEVQLRVKAARKAKRGLRRTGKAKVTADVTFTPTGGEAATQSTKLKLVKKSG